LPPAYVFLIFLGLFLLVGRLSLRFSELAKAAFFIRDFWGEYPPITAHFWTLAVEEQFYVLWPVFLVFVPRRGRMPAVIALVAIAPVWRWLNYEYLAGADGINRWRFDIVYDQLLVGCMLAMILEKRRGAAALQGKFFQNVFIVPICLVALAIFLSPYFIRGPWIVRGPSRTLSCVCVALIINRVIRTRTGPLAGFLNNRVIVWIGLLSYSIYIWQQLFCAVPPNQFLTRIPWNLAVTLLAAMFSYYIIERPSLRIRSWVEKTWAFRGKRRAVSTTEPSIAG
jgi:peptidoglycan/LPS O-acetylase OafA/YrhL